MKEVKLFETEDGKFFKSEKDAKIHEEKITLEEKFDDHPLVDNDNYVSFAVLIDWMKENNDLIEDCIDFCRKGWEDSDKIEGEDSE